MARYAIVMPLDERERLVAELKRALAFATAPAVSRIGQRHELPSFAKVRRPEPARSGERSISFTSELLEAVVRGAKTQTRRPIRPAPTKVWNGVAFADDGSTIPPLYEGGERVWVREKWARGGEGSAAAFVYARDLPEKAASWKSSRFMPREAARLFLRIERIMPVRLSSMDVADTCAEGVDSLDTFFELWDSIYVTTAFAAVNDPWVWRVEFKVDTK